MALSDCVDRVLVRLSPDGRLITWVTPSMLKSIGLSESEAAACAFANLARALCEAAVEVRDIGGVKLGMLGSKPVFKAALILAPNLKELLGDASGRPLLAVVPARNFLHLWAARHTDFGQRVGSVVVREHTQAAYPISMEVYEITDGKIRAIGEFPKAK